MMAEIRCPMCGKENPSEQDVCQFCQARLKPLVGQPPPGDGIDTPSEDVSSHEGEEQSESDFPEWLQNLRMEETEPQDRLPDDLESEEQPIRAETPPAQPEDKPDWLSSLRDDAVIEPESLDLEESRESDESFEPIGLEEESHSDFLSDFDDSREDVNLPEWLESLRSSGEADTKSSDIQEEEPDWLDRIRLRKDEDEREEYLASLEDRQDEAESVNLITSAGSEEPQVESRSSALDFDEQEPSVEPAELLFEKPEQRARKDERPQEDETSGLSLEIDEASEGQAVPAFDEKEFLVDPAAPDLEWLRDLKEETFSGEDEGSVTLGLDEIPAKPQEEIQESPEAVPDWLAEVTEVPQMTSADEPEELPDWLADEVDVSEASAPESEDMPDWLTELMPKETPSPPSAEELPVAAPVEPESGETPDWLAALGESSEAVPAADEIKEDGTKVATPLPITEDTEPLPSGEEGITEWVDQEAHGEEQSHEEAGESDLAPAVLPAWLQAMRPGGSAAPSILDVDADVVESAGPLVGLSGVLSADSDVARRQNVSTYAVKLQVSKEQRAHVDLLKDMVEGEGMSRPVPKQPVISPHNVLRWVITLVLFLAILWPAVTADLQVPMPAYSQETGEVNSLINDLPEDARILVAFDYQPGLAAEMDTTAAAVMDHIMLRGAYLTLVSTSPTGPLVAERFLSLTQSSHNYTRGEQYINMGYIPGGAAGLLSLAVSPQRTVPYTTDGVEAWETSGHLALPALQGVERLIDFSMILVIVDDPDVARSWVEQVQPYLTSEDGGTPLVMVVSAQSEPLIRPYYEASPRQLQGFVAGMRGGAAYARLTGRIGLPSRYWDGFSTGLTVAALLIAIGGVVNVATVFISRRNPSKGESQS